MRIVLGLDDSPHSHDAVEFLRKLPWAQREPWDIVSAVHLPIAAHATPGPASVGPAIEAAEAETRRQELWLAETERGLRELGLDTRTTLAEADARTALVDAARTHVADLLVVGSRGHSGIRRLLLGSVAQHVAVHAPCSVLVVRPAAGRPDFDRRPMKVVVGIDESPCSRAAVDFVEPLDWPERVHFEVVAAVPPASDSLGVADGLHVGFESSIVAQSRIRREIAMRYERRLRDAGYLVSSQAPLGDPREEILRVIAETGADLLVVGSHGRTGLSKLLLGSVSSYAVGHASCSVLVVKPPRRV